MNAITPPIGYTGFNPSVPVGVFKVLSEPSYLIMEIDAPLEDLVFYKYASIYLTSGSIDIDGEGIDNIEYPDDGSDIKQLNINPLRTYYYQYPKMAERNFLPMYSENTCFTVPVFYNFWKNRDNFSFKYKSVVFGHTDNDISLKWSPDGRIQKIQDITVSAGSIEEFRFSGDYVQKGITFITNNNSKCNEVRYIDIKPYILTTDSFTFSSIVSTARLIEKIKRSGLLDTSQILAPLKKGGFIQALDVLGSWNQFSYGSNYQVFKREITDPDLGVITLSITRKLE